ncbi:hypothetical protein HHK36_005881 [Tetracentron sinense]|uniref:J domain-containing protein n=1 Tax=Tetracentron sinense TaxID=13715 RepID=A0A835DRF4_TETSI|nr:hypothetical protein HHK36_005881 [Tetracentron sinense]
MLGTLTFPTGASSQFMAGNPLFPSGPSGSHHTMSFRARNPHRITIRAFAGTAARFETKKPANLYEILRIQETASAIDIKTAYRSLAKRYHPDAASSKSDGGDFIEIHKAYATLSDPTARARYDLSIAAGNGRRFSYSGSYGRQTRRWETDQCCSTVQGYIYGVCHYLNFRETNDMVVPKESSDSAREIETMNSSFSPNASEAKEISQPTRASPLSSVSTREAEPVTHCFFFFFFKFQIGVFAAFISSAQQSNFCWVT